MITRELFLATIQKIKAQEAKIDGFENALSAMGDGHYIFDTENQYLSALLELLKEVFHDQGEWIDWWLFEASSDRTVTWEENGEEHSADLAEPETLYDFLMQNAQSIPDEKLPIIAMDEDDGKNHAFPRQSIEMSDFNACFDSVLRYMDHHDVALHILENGQPKYVLLNKKCYDRLNEEISGLNAKEGE